VNRYLIEVGGFDIHTDDAIGIIPETGCRYRSPLRFPDIVDAGMRAARIGRSSVVYDVSLFREGAAVAAAEGHSVHVFVDRRDQSRTVPIPPPLRQALERILVAE